MPNPRGRRRAAFLAALAATLVLSSTPPLVAAHHSPFSLDHFREAVGQVESGGNYTAVNSASGAYGKYQIMPSNWPAWAGQYLGDRNAPWTPANQDTVATRKMHDLHNWLGGWDYVAYWWLTGSGNKDRATWSSFARSYVDKVMAAYEGRLGAGLATVLAHDDRSTTYTGPWGVAEHPNYYGGVARTTDAPGASVTLTFIGTAVTWYGPVGPTRGRAQVFIDGVLVRTIDTYAASFSARRVLYTHEWPSIGRHRLAIVAEGTADRPTLAIDSFGVRDFGTRLPREVSDWLTGIQVPRKG